MIRQHVLPNGLTLLTESMPNIRSVTLGVWLKQGSRHETSGENGISHFIEHLVFKGTQKRSAQEIAKTIDRLGGGCDAFTSKEFTCFYARALDEHVSTAFDLLSDIVLNPRFLPEHIEKERQVIFEEIKMVEDSPDELVYDLFTETIWKDHPLGRPIQGTVDSVSALDTDTLTGFFRDSYTPGNVVISAAGNLEHDQFADLATRAFAGLAPGNGTRAIQPPMHQTSVITREKSELEQLHLCLGVPAYAHDDPGRYVGYVMNTILGGAMSSRLFQKVREERGLAYSVYSAISSFVDTGFMAVYAATRPGGLSELLESICGELAQIKAEEVQDDELQGAKDHIKGSLMLSLESSSSRMSNLARQHVYFGRQFELDEIVAGIDAVTAESVRALACEVLDSRRVTAAILGRLDGVKLDPGDISF